MDDKIDISNKLYHNHILSTESLSLSGGQAARHLHERVYVEKICLEHL